MSDATQAHDEMYVHMHGLDLLSSAALGAHKAAIREALHANDMEQNLKESRGMLYMCCPCSLQDYNTRDHESI